MAVYDVRIRTHASEKEIRTVLLQEGFTGMENYYYKNLQKYYVYADLFGNMIHIQFRPGQSIRSYEMIRTLIQRVNKQLEGIIEDQSILGYLPDGRAAGIFLNWEEWCQHMAG